jgi:hypothetical protein
MVLNAWKSSGTTIEVCVHTYKPTAALVVWLVVIASAYRTEDPGFESRQGVRFLVIDTLQCCCHYLIRIVIVCI